MAVTPMPPPAAASASLSGLVSVAATASRNVRARASAAASAGGFTTNAFYGEVAVLRHRGSANYLFADAHVETLGWTRVRALLGPPITRFVRPDGQDPAR